MLRSKQSNYPQKVALKPKQGKILRAPQSTNKIRIIQHSGLCLSFLALSFTTTSVALAFVDLGQGRRVTDIYGRATDNGDTQNIDTSLNTIDDYLRQSQEFYRNITRKNLPGVLNQLESILGQLGIPNPRKYPQTIESILNNAGVGSSTSTTPSEIYVNQQTITDSANSGSFWIYTDSVLGNGEEEGQSRLEGMEQTSSNSALSSLQGQQKSISQSEQAVKSAQIASVAATKVERLSQLAQQRKVSQDVFKDVAAQQAELALSNSAIANTLAAVSGQSAIASAQTAAMAAQSQITNQHLTQLQVGQTMGNVQLHDIFNAQRHAIQLSAIESQKNAQLSVGSTDAIYIPGLFSQQGRSLSD